jgi:hypothetical protein
LSRSSASSLLAFLLLAGSASAEVRLEMAGVVQAGPPRLEVRVDLANRGDTPARGVSVDAEMLGQRQQARFDDALAPGGTSSAVFRFEVGDAPAGVHALALHLQFARSASASDVASQRGYLLLALGESPAPAVRMGAGEVRLGTEAPIAVRLESADGRTHRVRLRVLAPRGLQPFGPRPVVDVPPQGAVVADVLLLRGGAPRPSRQGVVVLAETVDEAPANASAATVIVEVQADPAWLPRLRRPLTGVGLVLLAAVYLDLWRQRRRKDDRAPAPPPPSPA